MSYSEQLDTLADTVGRQLVELWEQLDAGTLERDEYVELASVLVLLGAAQAARLAELSLAAQLAAAGVPNPLPAVVELPAAREPAIRKALTDALTSPDVTDRLYMAGRSEPIAAAHEAWESALPKRSGVVTGYRRGLNAGACELCTWWARDGRKWPTGHPMPSHKGCLCAPVVAVGGPPARPVVT